MSNNISSYYVNAFLSHASYANVSPDSSAAQNESLLEQRFGSETLASELMSEFNIVASDINSPSGFDAVIFERNGEFYFSLRGTEEALDLLANADIVAEGFDIEQTLAMINFYIRATAQGQLVPQYDFALFDDKPTDQPSLILSDGSYLTITDTGFVQGENISGLKPNTQFSISGHSLKKNIIK